MPRSKADPPAPPKPPTPRPADDTAGLSQREKFIRAAREAGCDETGEAFERAFARAFPPRKPGEPVAPYAEHRPPRGSRRKPKAEPT
jgi:hypothetical protein